MQEYIVSQLLHYCNISINHCGKINSHTIDFYDFTFVLDGKLIYYVNGTKYELNKNDAIFLRPGTTRGRDETFGNVSYVSFNFQVFDDSKLPFAQYSPNCINANIRKFVSIYPTSHLSPLYFSKEKCMMMLNYILYEMMTYISVPFHNEHVNSIIKYIDAHITEKLSLVAISKKVNLSREYTAYIFKKEMSKTLITYINERKLILAKELISQQQMTLNEVAYGLGFENYNYFCRIFKKYFGITPGQLKQKEKSNWSK